MMIKTVKMKNDKNPAAEMDFLMEALIMSKFQHPNIVQFIGVCFEKHPRWVQDFFEAVLGILYRRKSSCDAVGEKWW